MSPALPTADEEAPAPAPPKKKRRNLKEMPAVRWAEQWANDLRAMEAKAIRVAHGVTTDDEGEGPELEKLGKGGSRRGRRR